MRLSSFRFFEEFAAHYRAKDDEDTRQQSANIATRLCDEGTTPEDAYEQAEAFAEGRAEVGGQQLKIMWQWTDPTAQVH